MENFTWSPRLAYIVGLLVTDGNLSKDGRHINFRSSDIDLLQTFSSCLSLNNKIAKSYNNGYAKKPSYRLQFGNVHFYRWLLKIGLFPAKTYTIGEIKVPNKYFRDFLRGHLDGDGSIVTYEDRYNQYFGRTYINQRVFIKFISASEGHILWLLRTIHTLTDMKGSLAYVTPREINKVKIWSIKFAKKESIKMLNWLYYEPDLPCLKRKNMLANEILNKITYEKRRKYERIKF